MKKGKIWVVILIGLLMAGGLVLASCSACPNSGGCTVSNNGSGSTCTEGGCAAYNYMKNFSSSSATVPPACDC